MLQSSVNLTPDFNGSLEDTVAGPYCSHELLSLALPTLSFQKTFEKRSPIPV